MRHFEVITKFELRSWGIQNWIYIHSKFTQQLTRKMLKYFTFCDPARNWPVTWDCRILEAQSCMDSTAPLSKKKLHPPLTAGYCKISQKSENRNMLFWSASYQLKCLSNAPPYLISYSCIMHSYPCHLIPQDSFDFPLSFHPFISWTLRQHIFKWL